MLQAQPRHHPRKLQKKESKSYTPKPVPNMEVADEELNVEAESNSVNAEPFSILSITEEDEEVPTQCQVPQKVCLDDNTLLRPISGVRLPAYP
jgi:hypothetical protein